MASPSTELHPETPKLDYDIEALTGGSSLARQISVQLSAEQFERLYLQPGGQSAKGDLAKRVGNPTPLGVASFAIALSCFAADLMGFSGVSTSAAVSQVGAFYFVAGLGLTLAGIFEWIIGNTFPSVVFTTFGGFWLSAGFLFQPSQGIAAAIGGPGSLDYNKGIALYLASWGVLTFVYLITALRTNVVFVLLFFFLDITFFLLTGTYILIGNGNVANLTMMLHVSGAFAFLTVLCGWYLLVVLMFGSTGIPIALPVGDLSGFLSGKSKEH